jgi:nucleoside-diphosphate-sugar epimerase
MRIWVTGCAGFIGSKVAELLLEDGHTVVGIDNLNDAYDVRLKEWRLRTLQGRSGFTFHKLDISDRGSLRNLAAPEAVVNLAARAGVRQSLEDPWVYLQTNVTGTLNLLDVCRERRVRKFVLASTSSVYGSRETSRPFREDDPTDRPLSPYAATKKAAEALAFSYHHLHGLDVSILRYFTVYGPAGRPDMSIFRFVKWIAEDRPLELYGDGHQQRDFSHVNDIARGTILALKPLGYEIINLGGDRPIVLRDVIRLIEQGLGKQARIERRAAHQTDVPGTWADVAKARRLLGWSPQVSFEEGLKGAIEWYAANRAWAKELG